MPPALQFAAIGDPSSTRLSGHRRQSALIWAKAGPETRMAAKTRARANRLNASAPPYALVVVVLRCGVICRLAGRHSRCCPGHAAPWRRTGRPRAPSTMKRIAPVFWSVSIRVACGCPVGWGVAGPAAWAVPEISKSIVANKIRRMKGFPFEQYNHIWGNTSLKPATLQIFTGVILFSFSAASARRFLRVSGDAQKGTLSGALTRCRSH